MSNAHLIDKHAILVCIDLLAHLETFVTVADERSFTRAAHLLELPQPLLSRRVKALERSWGGPLFDRSPRRLQLTPLGQLALPQARDVVQRARHLRDAVAAARSSAIHLLAVPSGCPAPALAAVIRAGAAHGVTIAVHEEPATARGEALRDGRRSAAAIRVPTPAALCVRAGLAGADASLARGPIHLDALRPPRGAAPGAPLVRLGPEDDLEPFSGALRRAVARAGLPETAVRGVDSLAAGAAAVLADGGFVLADERAARHHGLAWAPFADSALHRGYELVLGSRSGLDRATQRWLAPLVADALGARRAPEDGERATGERWVAPPADRLAARGS